MSSSGAVLNEYGDRSAPMGFDENNPAFLSNVAGFIMPHLIVLGWLQLDQHDRFGGSSASVLRQSLGAYGWRGLWVGWVGVQWRQRRADGGSPALLLHIRAPEMEGAGLFDLPEAFGAHGPADDALGAPLAGLSPHGATVDGRRVGLGGRCEQGQQGVSLSALTDTTRTRDVARPTIRFRSLSTVHSPISELRVRPPTSELRRHTCYFR